MDPKVSVAVTVRLDGEHTLFCRQAVIVQVP
jgi:hypothetical protein